MEKNKEKGLEKIAVFQGKNIRRVFHEGEWHFSIVDIIQVLSGTDNPRRYWSDLKRKVKKEGYVELYGKIVQLKFTSSDGKRYATDAERYRKADKEKGRDKGELSAGEECVIAGKAIWFD